MAKINDKKRLIKRRQQHIRKKIFGTSEVPRLRVTRSEKHIYAQIIDDSAGRTLASASSLSLKIPGANTEAAEKVGQALGEAAKAAEHPITRICFDRGGHIYHGRVKALADAARKAGLQF